MGRFPVQIFSEKSLDGKATPIAIGIVTDLSVGGLGVIIDRPVAPGMQLVILMDARQAGTRYITATVRWKNLLPTTNRILRANTNSNLNAFWRVGLSFEGVADADQAAFVASLIKSLNDGQ